MESNSTVYKPLAQPGRKNARSRVKTWLIRIAIGIAALPLVLVLAGAIYQAAASALAWRANPPPGQLVEVGGYRMHIYCMGEGSPTVILDASNGGMVSNWAWIQPELAITTRVCAYDRPGLGWSEFSPQPQDTVQNSEALHTLLARAEEPGPYVLVGHSFGGLYTRIFAEMYPDEVAGMVFIEGSLPDGQKAQGRPDRMPGAPDEAMIDSMPVVSRIGLLRFTGPARGDPDLPEKQYREMLAYGYSNKWAELIKRQFHLYPTLLAQVRPLYVAGSLGDRPLAVVLGTEGDGAVPELAALFEQQAALSTDHKTYRIEGADHISLVDRKEYADQTRVAIEDVVAAVRSGE